MLDMEQREGKFYFLQRNLPIEAQYEQLAEEAAELAQAALKTIRARGNGNPTPISYSDAIENLMDEIADVFVCLQVLELYPGAERMDSKLERWCDRVKEAQNV